MLRRIFLILAFLLVLVVPGPVRAGEDRVNIHFFMSETCPHCAKEKVFLRRLEDRYDEVEVYKYEVTDNRENVKLLRAVGEELGVEVSGVPFTVIGEEHITGYLDDESTGRLIETAVVEAREGYRDVVLEVAAELEFGERQSSEGVSKLTADAKKAIPENISLPIIGKVRIKDLSLPALTLVIALLDGFNPCAMWVLLFLISLLLGMKDRFRMWVLGGVFILASGVVYFLFLTAWLNLFLFLGFVYWIRVLVGLFALGAGGYYLREYWVNRDGACKVTKNKGRQRVFEKLREITQRKEFLVALFGIVVLAFAVNLVELVCSAGLPALFTQVLSLTQMPRWQYYLYLLFYIVVFMLDDLVVFVVAMVTLKSIGVDGKYARYSHLIGGILMFLIGLAMLFKPELLMFG